MFCCFHSRLVILLAIGGLGASASWVGAAPDLAEAEIRTALEASLNQNKELEAKLTAEKEASQLLAAKVGILTAEAANLREELNKAKLLNEALGPGAASERGLEKRILDALNDLRVMKEQKEALEAKLHRLVEAVSVYLSASDEQKGVLREKLNQALAEAAATPQAAPAPASAARIESSRVVSVKPEHKLVVFNAGLEAGMKVGTPLRIYRHDRPTASAVVIEVRPHVSGGLITQVEGNNFPRVGDTLRIDTRTEQ